MYDNMNNQNCCMNVGTKINYFKTKKFDFKLDLATLRLYILLPHGFEEKNAKNPATQ